MAKITKKIKINDMKVFNSLNAAERQKNYKMFTQPSQTIPDQTMSIKEIMERYAKGLPIGGGLTPIYEEEDSMGINPKILDLVDIQAMSISNKNQIEHLQDKVNKEKIKKNSEKTVKTEEQP
jgi:hypothetical protein